MSDYIDLIAGKPLEPWAEQAMKDRAYSKAGAVERAREVARDLRLRLSAMGINLTDDARTAINQAFLALPTTMAGDYVMVPRDLMREAQFLCDRLDDLEWGLSMDEFANLHAAHVDPSHSRLKGLLAASPTGGE